MNVLNEEKKEEIKDRERGDKDLHKFYCVPVRLHF